MWSEIERLERDLDCKINWTLDWLRKARNVTGDSTFQARWMIESHFQKPGIQNRKRAGREGPRSCVSFFDQPETK